MQKIVITGNLKAGKLNFDRNFLRAELAQIPDCPVTITIDCRPAKRTVYQNRFFHGPVISAFVRALKEVGQDTLPLWDYRRRESFQARVNQRTAKEFLWLECCPVVLDPETGDRHYPRTSEMSVDTFSEFLKAIESFFLDNRVPFPAPNFEI
jgi:hypothetical protein